MAWLPGRRAEAAPALVRGACFLRASLGLHELHQVGESRENEAAGRGRHSWSPNTSGQTNQVGGAFPSQPPVAKSIPQEEQWILLQVLS